MPDRRLTAVSLSTVKGRLSAEENEAVRKRLAAGASPASIVLRSEAGKACKHRVMNKLEQNFAWELEDRRKAGVIEHWGFEEMRFRLGQGAWYKPDFVVHVGGGVVVCYECKGFWREAARVRIKVAAERYPFISFVAVTKVAGQWRYEDFTAPKR